MYVPASSTQVTGLDPRATCHTRKASVDMINAETHGIRGREGRKSLEFFGMVVSRTALVF